MLQEHSLRRAIQGTGSSVNFAGTWTNALGSEMVIIQTGSDISGEYESSVSGSGSKTKGELVGFVDGDLISFVVRWYDFQAITSWVGQLDPKAAQETIQTLWQMTKQVDDGDEWASINSGADRFSRKN